MSKGPKTTLHSLIRLLVEVDALLTLEGLTEDAINNMPVKIAAMKNKPYLNIGPFWIKTEAGYHTVYVWNKLAGQLDYKCKYYLDPEGQLQVIHATDVDPNNWVPPFADDLKN